MIYITGSTYGDYNRFLEDRIIASLTENDYLIIAGDFGFINSEEGTITEIVENEILDALEQAPYTILFIEGVHEHFKTINAYPIELWCGGKIHRIRKNIAHLMRGQVFEIEGKRVFTMGGAISSSFADMEKPEDKQNYNPDSLPSIIELEEGWKCLEKVGFEVDIVVTYTATAEMIMIYYPMRHMPYGGKLLPFLDKVMERVQYKAWYCGWFHMDMRKVLEGHPIGKYCAEKKMYPVYLKIYPVNV